MSAPDSPERLALDRLAMAQYERARALDFALVYHRDIARSAWPSATRDERPEAAPADVLATADTFLNWLAL